MEYVIITSFIAYAFWVYISNADLKIDRIKSYLKEKELNYVRHSQVRKNNFPKFDIGEGIFTWLFFRIHHYEIDATDDKGNPITVAAVYFQTVTFFYKNRVFFNLLKS